MPSTRSVEVASAPSWWPRRGGPRPRVRARATRPLTRDERSLLARSQQRLPRARELPARAAAAAARRLACGWWVRWALVAVDVVRDVFGEDSPTFSCWAESLSSGCWEVEGGSFDFYQRFLDAGLSAPLPAHSDAAKYLDASGAAAGGLDGAGGRGSRLSGTNHQHAKSSARPRGHALPLCTSFVDLSE